MKKAKTTKRAAPKRRETLASLREGIREWATNTAQAWNEVRALAQKVQAITEPRGSLEKVRNWATNQVAVMCEALSGVQRGLERRMSDIERTQGTHLAGVVFTDAWRQRIEKLEASVTREPRPLPKLVKVGYRRGASVYLDPAEVTAVAGGSVDQQGIAGVRIVVRGRTGDAKQRNVFVDQAVGGRVGDFVSGDQIASLLGRL